MQKSRVENAALVIEGGGFRGIFTAGVLEVLLENNIIFNCAIGVSAGASYGVSYVSQEAGRNFKVNKLIGDKRYSSIRNLLKDGSLFSWDFIFNIIPNKIVLLNYEAFRTSPTQFWVGVTNCKTGKSEYIHINPTNNNEFKTVLSASCSLPFIAPKVAYKNNLYIDGGLSDSIPYEQAIAAGYPKVLVILTRPKGYTKKPLTFPWFFKWYYRKYPKIVQLLISRHERYNNSIKQLEEFEKQRKVFIIRPESDIEVSRLENNSKKTEKVYFQAMELARKQLPELKQWLIE